VSGTLKLRMERTYSLSEAAQAHRDLESRKTAGKLLLVPRVCGRRIDSIKSRTEPGEMQTCLKGEADAVHIRVAALASVMLRDKAGQSNSKSCLSDHDSLVSPIQVVPGEVT
jgi:hypothetical protein